MSLTSRHPKNSNSKQILSNTPFAQADYPYVIFIQDALRFMLVSISKVLSIVLTSSGVTQPPLDGTRAEQSLQTSLKVKRASPSIQNAFVHHFRQGRMREHRLHQILFGRLKLLSDHIALDQLSHFGPDHMRAQ